MSVAKPQGLLGSHLPVSDLNQIFWRYGESLCMGCLAGSSLETAECRGMASCPHGLVLPQISNIPVLNTNEFVFLHFPLCILHFPGT